MTPTGLPSQFSLFSLKSKINTMTWSCLPSRISLALGLPSTSHYLPTGMKIQTMKTFLLDPRRERAKSSPSLGKYTNTVENVTDGIKVPVPT
jgi:hypothetical protein